MTFDRPLTLLPMALVTREDWDAKPPRWSDVVFEPPVHHYVVEYAARHPAYSSSTSNLEGDLHETMRKLQKNHMVNKSCPDIKYNFLVGYDGRVYEGRGWNIQPTLPDKYGLIKDKCVFIGWIGMFPDQITAKEIKPPKHVVDTRRNLMHYGMVHKHISHILRIFFIKQGNHRRRGDFGDDWE